MGEYTLPASTVVKMLHAALRGQTVERIARETVTDKAVVAATFAAHGHPSVREMTLHVEALQPLGDMTVTFNAPGDHREPRPHPAAPLLRIPSAPGEDRSTTLIAAGKESSKASIRRAAENIERSLKTLADMIAADSEDAKRRAEIARLEARIAELKRAGKRVPIDGSSPADHVCPEPGCGKGFPRPQGLALHRRRVHEGFDPMKAAKS